MERRAVELTGTELVVCASAGQELLALDRASGEILWQIDRIWDSFWSGGISNPLEAIEVAITRCDPELTTCDEPWIPDERVDLATMLAAYTIGGAYAGFEERESGSLEAGKLADLGVLDRNLFTIPAGEISETTVLLTLFEGRTVHGSLDSMKAKAAGKGGL